MRVQLAKRAATYGFVGLGNMGGPMAINLAQKGNHNLKVFDVSHKNCDRVMAACREGSVEVMATPAEVAEGCNVVCTMLPSNQHVEEVYMNPEKGLLSTAAEYSLFLDSSTISPQTAKIVSVAAEDKNCSYLDAPVSGGVGAASKGHLTFMVGNDSDYDYEHATSVLQYMGSNMFSISGVGNGQVAKICNNMMLGISMIGIAEAMNLGIRLGIDKAELANIINVSSGRCWASESYIPVPDMMPGLPASNKWEGGFGSQLMLKDLALAQDCANDVLAHTPLGAQALQTYRTICQKGYSQKDFGSIYHYLAQQGPQIPETPVPEPEEEASD